MPSIALIFGSMPYFIDFLYTESVPVAVDWDVTPTTALDDPAFPLYRWFSGNTVQLEFLGVVCWYASDAVRVMP